MYLFQASDNLLQASKAEWIKCQEKLDQRGSLKTSEYQLIKCFIKEKITQFKFWLQDRGYPDNFLEHTLSELIFSERKLTL